jgi:MacB-like periplasmic core domain
MTTTSALVHARLHPADLGRLAAVGLRTRKLRALLSALGITIGVAAIVAVLGLSGSSQNGLLTEIAQLGTNLLTVQNGQSLTSGTAELPAAAPAMIGRLPGVLNVQSAGTGEQRECLPHPADPLGGHQWAFRRRQQSRPAERVGHVGYPGRVPQRGNR